MMLSYVWTARAGLWWMLFVKSRNGCSTACSSSWLLMRLKVLIFRGNALIYIKGTHIFLWPTFSQPLSLPQVHVSRAEELYRPLPAPASQAAGPDGSLHKKSLDQGVEGLQGWQGGQTLWVVHASLSQHWDPCGYLSPISHHLWHHGWWIHSECHHWKNVRASTHMRSTDTFKLRSYQVIISPETVNISYLLTLSLYSFIFVREVVSKKVRS